MLEGALVAGLCSAGVDVRTAGIIPTPGVAFLTIDEGARAGAVISASHNPVPDNGIKFFSDLGIKVSAEVEDEIERLMAEPPELPEGAAIGSSTPLSNATDRYVDHLLGTLEHSLSGITVVLDCAFGAAWHVGPRAFREAGAQVIAMNAEADGAASTSIAARPTSVRSPPACGPKEPISASHSMGMRIGLSRSTKRGPRSTATGSSRWRRSPCKKATRSRRT